MNFKKTNFEIIKKAIDPSLADFLFNYLELRKNVCDYLHSEVLHGLIPLSSGKQV